jgi:nicotinamidase-related amidase
VKDMRGRGYNVVLLRDATTGVEFPDTLDQLFATELAIREVEQKYGFSVSNENFFTACGNKG